MQQTLFLSPRTIAPKISRQFVHSHLSNNADNRTDKPSHWWDTWQSMIAAKFAAALVSSERLWHHPVCSYQSSSTPRLSTVQSTQWHVQQPQQCSSATRYYTHTHTVITVKVGQLIANFIPILHLFWTQPFWLDGDNWYRCLPHNAVLVQHML